MIPLVLVLAIAGAGTLAVISQGNGGDDSATEPTSTTSTATTAEVPSTTAQATTTTVPPPAVPGFVGGWAGTDLDGSSMWLWIEPTTDPDRYAVAIFDEGASACDSDLTVAGRMETSGIAIGGETFEGDPASFVCLYPDGDVTLDPIVVAYTYRPDDTLTSPSSEVIWNRTNTPKEAILGG